MAALLVAAWAVSGLYAGGSPFQSQRFALFFASGYWLALGALGAFIAIWLRRDATAFTILALGVVVSWAAMACVVGRCNILASEQPLAQVVEQAATGPALVAIEGRLERHSAFVFYLPRRLRPVLIVEGQRGGDLEFGSRFPGAAWLFVSRQQFGQLCAAAAQGGLALFYLTDDPPQASPPPSLRPLLHLGGAMVWSSGTVDIGQGVP
jgi:hypothetical protein